MIKNDVTSKAVKCSVEWARARMEDYSCANEANLNQLAITSLLQGLKVPMEVYGIRGGQYYESYNGVLLRRENYTSDNGNEYVGIWVLRNPDGEVIDFDTYRIDIAERNGLELP